MYIKRGYTTRHEIVTKFAQLVFFLKIFSESRHSLRCEFLVNCTHDQTSTTITQIAELNDKLCGRPTQKTLFSAFSAWNWTWQSLISW